VEEDIAARLRYSVRVGRRRLWLPSGGPSRDAQRLPAGSDLQFALAGVESGSHRGYRSRKALRVVDDENDDDSDETLMITIMIMIIMMMMLMILMVIMMMTMTILIANDADDDDDDDDDDGDGDYVASRLPFSVRVGACLSCSQ
jgi:hypothetical protein